MAERIRGATECNDFLHFHTHTHEVLGIARGTVRAEFGGDKGKILS